MKNDILKYHKIVFKNELKMATWIVIVVLLATIYIAHNNIYVMLGYTFFYFLIFFKFRHDRKKEYFKTVRGVIFDNNFGIDV